MLLANVIFSSKYIIHTVGPIYNRCNREENARVLEKCYTNSLKLAVNAADEKIRKIVGTTSYFSDYDELTMLAYIGLPTDLCRPIRVSLGGSSTGCLRGCSQLS